MQKVISYTIVECFKVTDYLDKGWQPWGNAILSWDGRNNAPCQPMVKYEENAVLSPWPKPPRTG